MLNEEEIKLIMTAFDENTVEEKLGAEKVKKIRYSVENELHFMAENDLDFNHLTTNQIKEILTDTLIHTDNPNFQTIMDNLNKNNEEKIKDHQKIANVIASGAKGNLGVTKEKLTSALEKSKIIMGMDPNNSLNYLLDNTKDIKKYAITEDGSVSVDKIIRCLEDRSIIARIQKAERISSLMNLFSEEESFPDQPRRKEFKEALLEQPELLDKLEVDSAKKYVQNHQAEILEKTGSKEAVKPIDLIEKLEEKASQKTIVEDKFYTVRDGARKAKDTLSKRVSKSRKSIASVFQNPIKKPSGSQISRDTDAVNKTLQTIPELLQEIQKQIGEELLRIPDDAKDYQIKSSLTQFIDAAMPYEMANDMVKKIDKHLQETSRGAFHLTEELQEALEFELTTAIKDMATRFVKSVEHSAEEQYQTSINSLDPIKRSFVVRSEAEKTTSENQAEFNNIEDAISIALKVALVGKSMGTGRSSHIENKSQIIRKSTEAEEKNTLKTSNENHIISEKEGVLSKEEKWLEAAKPRIKSFSELEFQKQHEQSLQAKEKGIVKHNSSPTILAPLSQGQDIPPHYQEKLSELLMQSTGNLIRLLDGELSSGAMTRDGGVKLRTAVDRLKSDDLLTKTSNKIVREVNKMVRQDSNEALNINEKTAESMQSRIHVALSDILEDIVKQAECESMEKHKVPFDELDLANKTTTLFEGIISPRATEEKSMPNSPFNKAMKTLEKGITKAINPDKIDSKYKKVKDKLCHLSNPFSSKKKGKEKDHNEPKPTENEQSNQNLPHLPVNKAKGAQRH